MKRRWTESSTPYQEAICNWYLVRKGQSVSCNRAATGHINSALGQTSHPLAEQHKMDSVVVCVQAGAWAHVSMVLCLTDHFLVWLFLFPLAIFFVVVAVAFPNVLVCFLREKEHGVGELGKNMTKTYCTKTVLNKNLKSGGNENYKSTLLNKCSLHGKLHLGSFANGCDHRNWHWAPLSPQIVPPASVCTTVDQFGFENSILAVFYSIQFFPSGVLHLPYASETQTLLRVSDACSLPPKSYSLVWLSLNLSTRSPVDG